MLSITDHEFFFEGLRASLPNANRIPTWRNVGDTKTTRAIHDCEVRRWSHYDVGNHLRMYMTQNDVRPVSLEGMRSRIAHGVSPQIKLLT